MILTTLTKTCHNKNWNGREPYVVYIFVHMNYSRKCHTCLTYVRNLLFWKCCFVLYVGQGCLSLTLSSDGFRND